VTTPVRVHYIDPPGEKGMITRVILDVLGAELPGERFGAAYTLTTVPAVPLPAEEAAPGEPD
jgi:hypothetical protein